MNIFEGARRIAIIIAAVSVVGAIAASLTRDPYVEISYEVPFYGFDPVKVDGCEYSSEDALISERRKTPSGISYHVEICFKAARADDGRMLVPYVRQGESFLMNEKYSEDVSSYTRSIIGKFNRGAEEWQEAKAEKSRVFWSGLMSMAVGIIASLAAFWIFVWAIGWIVRGFMGIPRGQDKNSPRRGGEC